MSIDYQIKKDATSLEDKIKRKRQRKIVQSIEESLRILVMERIKGRMGDC